MITSAAMIAFPGRLIASTQISCSIVPSLKHGKHLNITSATHDLEVISIFTKRKSPLLHLLGWFTLFFITETEGDFFAGKLDTGGHSLSAVASLEQQVRFSNGETKISDRCLVLDRETSPAFVQLVGRPISGLVDNLEPSDLAVY